MELSCHTHSRSVFSAVTFCTSFSAFLDISYRIWTSSMFVALLRTDRLCAVVETVVALVARLSLFQLVGLD